MIDLINDTDQEPSYREKETGETVEEEKKTRNDEDKQEKKLPRVCTTY